MIEGEKRVVSVDALRGLAALAVVLAHIVAQAPDNPKSSAFEAVLCGFYSFGSSGVVCFFLISGFCIHRRWALSPDQPVHFGKFWLRRLRRLWPPYAVSLAIYLIGLSLLGRFIWDREGLYNVFLHLAMLHNFDAGVVYGINGAFWSLAVEEQMYLAYAVFLRARVGWGWGATLWLGVSLRYLWLGLGLSVGGLPIGESLLYSWCLFMLGALSAEMHCGRLATPPWTGRLPVAVLCLGSSLALRNLLTAMPTLNWQVNEILMILGYFVLLNWAARRQPKGWALHGLVGSGTISYSLYLTHSLILSFFLYHARFVFHWSRLQTLAAGTFVGLPACLVLAYVFHRYVERPFLSRGWKN